MNKTELDYNYSKLRIQGMAYNSPSAKSSFSSSSISFSFSGLSFYTENHTADSSNSLEDRRSRTLIFKRGLDS